MLGRDITGPADLSVPRCLLELTVARLFFETKEEDCVLGVAATVKGCHLLNPFPCVG